jgi:hypothetical protein
VAVLARRGKRRSGPRDQAQRGQSEQKCLHGVPPSAPGAGTIGLAARTESGGEVTKGGCGTGLAVGAEARDFVHLVNCHRNPRDPSTVILP